MSIIEYHDQVILKAIPPPPPPDVDELNIQVVPAHEADAAAGKISEHAPVGSAVLRRREGDTVTVTANGASYTMRILKVLKKSRDC